MHETTCWRTTIGKWYPGEKVMYRQYDLHKDLMHKGWFNLFVYGVTGREYSQAELSILEAIWTCTSYPDLRLWNNRVAGLAGSTRSAPHLGITAALAVSQANIYGQTPNIGAITFLQQAANAQDLQQFVTEYLRTHRVIYGYGRPLVKKDERIPHLLDVLEHFSPANRYFVNLCFEVEKILQNSRLRMQMNIAALAAAVCLDLGFNGEEFMLFLVPSFLAGMPPCYRDTRHARENSFFQISRHQLEYIGAGERKWQDSA